MGKADLSEINEGQIEIVQNDDLVPQIHGKYKDSESKKANKILGNKGAQDDLLKIDSASDQSRLKVIKKEEISSTLSSPVKFWFIVLWLCMCQFIVGYNQAFIGAFVTTLTNKKNFDWEKKSTEYTTNVSLLTSLYFLGCTIATCTQRLFLRMNQRKLLLLLSVCTIGIALLSCIDNFIALVIGRVLIGYVSGLFRPVA